jgi:molybdate transport system regulatory protein
LSKKREISYKLAINIIYHKNHINLMYTNRTHPAFKLWLETEDGYVFGPGIYSLLKMIDQKGTLKEAASYLGMSYRFSWGLIKKAEEKIGEPLITSSKGGRQGGGSTELTDLGRRYVQDFENIMENMSRAAKFEPLTRVKGVVESLSRGKQGQELTVKLEHQIFKFNLMNEKVELNKGDNVILTLSLSSEQG